jgi:sugar/nucleoside kinase (ribokinase family)
MQVVCLGILVADFFTQPVTALPQPGELKTTDGFHLSAGGCAANVAVNLRRLGREVTVVGKVGQDRLGQFVVSELEEQHVETRWISRSATRATSITVILNVRGEDRRYLHSVGANGDFSSADISSEALRDARILYVGGYMAMPGFPAADLARVLQNAKNAGLTTVLDVVIPKDCSDAALQVSPVLPYTDYFLPNTDEAKVLTGTSDPVQQARQLSKSNPQATIVITLGSEGSLAMRDGRLIRTAPIPMQSIDESGAGDAFAAGLITGLLEDWPLEFTLKFAGVIGASCTRAVGCSPGVFHFQEALDFLNRKSCLTSNS